MNWIDEKHLRIGPICARQSRYDPRAGSMRTSIRESMSGQQRLGARMRVSKVLVRGYRSLRNVEVDIDNYTALIGPNGCGKSSVLYALNWFFNGGSLEAEDCHAGASIASTVGTEVAPESPLAAIDVSVTMVDLTAADRAVLGKYGRGDSVTFRRTWREDDKDKMIGNAWQGPGFAKVRAAGSAADVGTAYQAIQSNVAGLEPLTGKARILEALDDWEANNVDVDLLEEVPDDDASHLFGINGPNVIRDRVQLVLVPAAIDMEAQMSGASRGTALHTLVGALMTSAGALARTEWATKHAVVLEELNKSVSDGIAKATGVQQDRVNERLAEMVPGARVEFRPVSPPWAPKAEESVSTHVIIDGVADHISRHGHGVQRSLLLAMLQALAPDLALKRSEVTGGDTTDRELTADEQARLDEELKNLPHLIVCIEEPEIYQHPVRARAFARVLGDVADRPDVQVILATHSPYFVAPKRFESLRLFSISQRETGVRPRCSIGQVVTASGKGLPAVRKAVELHLPSAFAEGFFGEGTILVEGDTDRVVLEVLAERLGTPLDALGRSVVSAGGKTNLPIAYALLSSLGVKAYPLLDGDFLGADRKYGAGPTRTTENAASHAASHGSHRQQTDDMLAVLPPGATAVASAVPYTFGDPTVVTDFCTIWHDDIEAELETWPSFTSALTGAGGRLRTKDFVAYKDATIAANLADLPPKVRRCVEALTSPW